MIWIDEVEIIGFGPFPSLKANFQPGINFVVGDNESGKTSFHSAILGILFGIRHSNLYRREGATEFRGRLLLRQGSDQLEIQRSFSDDYMVVTRLGTKEISFSGRAPFLGRSQERMAYDQILQDWFGIDDQLLFRASVFVEQQALQVEPDREAGQQLSRLITGSEELPYEEIGADVLEKYFSFTKINPDGPDKQKNRELELVKEEIESTEKLLLEAEAIEQEYLKRREELEATEEFLDQLDRAAQKRRIKTESIAIEAEVAMVEEQIEQRIGIEEQLSELKHIKIPQSLSIPAIGITVASLGGMVLGFLCSRLFFFILVAGWLTSRWLAHTRKHRERRYRLEGQLELSRARSVLDQTLTDAKHKLDELTKESNAIEQTSFDDWPESQRRKREQEVRRQRLQLSERLAVLTQRMRSPEALREKVEELIARQKFLRQKTEALYLGYMMLQQATTDFKQEAFIRLQDAASEHFAHMTHGLYLGIKLDDQWQPMAITQTGTERTFVSLSSGTRDALLLSLRLSVGHLLSKGHLLPLILDDPIVFMDAQRRKLFINQLRPLAQEHQIILFTFDRTLPKNEDNLLPLHAESPMG